ncbi:hypothetical protein JCM8097_005215 [Rhodosporidiobolus ruineniae]
MASQLPKITHVLELCLYAKHLPTSVSFYRDTLRLGAPVLSTDRMAVFPLSNSTTLLLFQRGLTREDQSAGAVDGLGSNEPGDGVIPGHGLPDGDVDATELKQHFALAVEKVEDVEKWEEELKGQGVPILGRAKWPKGGRSVYFGDPDGHVGELVSRGIWPHY